MLHIVLVTFREDVDIAAARGVLTELARACSEVSVLKPSGAEAERSWHACVEVRGAVEETLASSPWEKLVAELVAKSEVHKAWTFSP